MAGGLSAGSPSRRHYIEDDGNGSNVMIPQTGAGKYWYVDPKAKGVPTPKPQEEITDALTRLGLLPEGTTPSF